MTRIITLVGMLCIASLFSDTINELHLYGDGLNIEGGVIPKFALRKDQSWANICFVLDTPLIDNHDLDEITAANSYVLKEASILDFNEPRAALLQALILKYYLKKDESFHIAVNVHRNRSGPAHLKLLERLIEACFEHTKIEEHKFQICNKTLSLHYGTLKREFEEADVIISISLIAGLNPQWKSGTPVLPKTFIPIDLHSMNLVLSAKFDSQNHLLNVFDEVLCLQDERLIELINQEFTSENPEKVGLKAQTLKKEDIKEGTIFQANGMFYPKKLEPSFEIY